jgi:predicted RNA-binding Zn-ribbon protein involved in translation (DUF1610 family)
MHTEKTKCIKRRLLARIVFWLSVIGFFGLMAIAKFAPEFYKVVEPYAFNYWAKPCWVLAIISMLYMHNAKCPACGNKFAVRSDGKYYNDFTYKCVNCGFGSESGVEL